MTDQEARIERLRKAGLPINAGHIVESSIVQGPGGTSNRFAMLDQIKRGALKGSFDKIVHADVPVANPNGFQIPEKKPVRQGPQNPNAPQSQKPKTSVPVQNFSAPRAANNAEADAIEAMFGGGAGTTINMRSPNGGVPEGDILPPVPMDGEIDGSSLIGRMPSFNPRAHLEKKAGVRTVVPGFQNEEQQAKSDMGAQSQGFSYQYLKEMIQDISKEISEKTIRQVLKEFSEAQKSKQYFEVYNKEQNVIKTQDGKYYKLTPVKLTQK